MSEKVKGQSMVLYNRLDISQNARNLSKHIKSDLTDSICLTAAEILTTTVKPELEGTKHNFLSLTDYGI